MRSDNSKRSVFGSARIPGPNHGRIPGSLGQHPAMRPGGLELEGAESVPSGSTEADQRIEESFFLDLQSLSRDDVRDILRTSEGIRSQKWIAQIKDGRVSPPPTGHPITSHLHSAERHDVEPETNKTKFLSMDDMVEALWQLLRTPVASEKIGTLVVGSRVKVTAEIGMLFGFECEVSDPQGRGTTHRVRFTREEQRQAGRSNTTCVAIVERRQRGHRSYLQIHTFYPKVLKSEAEALLAFIRARG